jgi:hypothetical protein
VLNLVHNFTQSLNSSPLDEDHHDLRTVPSLDDEIEDGIRALLLFRAVLCAALCATAADTSCVEGTELGQRVVQIL